VELADAVDCVRAGQRKPASVIVWENIRGVLSDKGNAFGCFLGALAGEDGELQPPGKKWQDAGYVYGPKRTIAWRILDAQYFGLAQRRFVCSLFRVLITLRLSGGDGQRVLFHVSR
jgi:DNA (cytosine-5)-methyltransferase 1